MKTLCVIPARGGSKTVSDKNIKMVGGKPLIGFVIEAALSANVFDKVILSTDSEEIADIVSERYSDIEIPFMRPAEYATDNVPVTTVIKHAVNYFEKEGYDFVFSVQPTNPFTTYGTLIKSVEVMRMTGCDSVVTLGKVLQYHPFRTYSYDHGSMTMSSLTEYTTEDFLQKQDRPDAYGLTGGVLGRKVHLLTEWNGEGFALGDDQRGIVVSDEEAFDLDTPFEMETFEGLILLRKGK